MVMFARSGGLWPPPQSIDILPQISRIYTEVRLSSRGCTCLKCTNRARRRINRIYRCYFFNNGLNGLIGFFRAALC